MREVDYGSGAQESYSYDHAGNRIRRVLNGRATSYAYDSRNRLLSRLEDDAFGHTLSATEGIPNRFRYVGEQFDPVKQQYYLRAVLQPGHCPLHSGGRVPR
ncbi:hypothetical protein ABU162_08965 [Paenibacillus thiaminolyticus]|uniref:hypothetical protein n=1 Tax=Paenibacillus thiaminolyticus TaxID=49283 RepID=UPI0035A6371C